MDPDPDRFAPLDRLTERKLLSSEMEKRPKNTENFSVQLIHERGKLGDFTYLENDLGMDSIPGPE